MIAAAQQFRKRERFRDREEYREQFWGSKGEGPSKGESQIGVRERKEARRPKGSGWIKRTEVSVFSSIRSLILHLVALYVLENCELLIAPI